MSARAGLQPDVLRGQDSGASSDSPLLAAALVPGFPGPGTGGDSVHHHHLHPEVMKAEGGTMLLSLVNAYACGTHANGCVDCSGSVLLGGGGGGGGRVGGGWGQLWRGLYYMA